MVVSTGMLVVSQLALFFGGDFCELGLSSQLRLLFLPEEALGVGVSCGYTDHHQGRGHPGGRQPHSLIFMSTLYNAV